jgi:hypothetical protein
LNLSKTEKRIGSWVAIIVGGLVILGALWTGGKAVWAASEEHKSLRKSQHDIAVILERQDRWIEQANRRERDRVLYARCVQNGVEPQKCLQIFQPMPPRPVAAPPERLETPVDPTP